MKKSNTITSIAFSLIIAFTGGMPTISNAASFQPTSRTHYPSTAAGVQPITIVNNNYNNNINTNNNPAPTVARAAVAYAAPAVDVHALAQKNLPTYTPPKKKSTYKATVSRHDAIYGSNHAHTATCGAKVAIGSARVAKPTCSLVPAINPRGAIELQWTTSGATVAYLDNGIGHVNTIRGKRVITPSNDTAYNLTVLNDAGIASSCGARVNVSLATASDVNVIATNTNYSYSLNGQRQVASVSNTRVSTGGGTMQVNNTAQTNTQNTKKEESVSTETTKDTQSTDTAEDESLNNGTSTVSTGFIGEGFKKVAVPVGIVFLILIVLLVIIMSKVKAAKA